MTLLSSLLLGLALVPAQGPSVKDLFDAQLSQLRMAQRPDGSYGHRIETANVLIGMALSPRAYREDDGPFVRDAVSWLISNSGSVADPRADAATAFALQCLHAERYEQTIAELAERSGLTSAALSGLAALGHLPNGEWDERALDGLPLPERAGLGAGAAQILMSIQEMDGLPPRARACAVAGVALRAAKAADSLVLEDHARLARASYERGVDYLLTQRGASGLWEVFGQPEAGLSAMAAKSLLGSNRAEVREAAVPTLDWLRSLQHEDGSIHQGRVATYVTSVAIMALAAADRPEDREAIARAADFLRAIQADEGEGYSEGDKFYGGIGYGGDLRPDLSNLQFALQALHDSGAAVDDPAYARAIAFLNRTQNRSESNPETFVDSEGREVQASNDGGATYYPGNSPAGTIELADGTYVARSYGSMTYALLKCYLFAGVPADDPRIVAAMDWIAHHWTLEVNPGFDTMRDPRAGFQGLFYYYQSLAEALRTAGVDSLTSADGSIHDWRSELRLKLVGLQSEDGSWVNEFADRWWEGNPVLCTAYALNALHAARQ